MTVPPWPPPLAFRSASAASGVPAIFKSPHAGFLPGPTWTYTRSTRATLSRAADARDVDPEKVIERAEKLRRAAS